MTKIDILGVPTDYGANRRGVDMGPSAIRYAGLLNEIESLGLDCERDLNITVPPIEEGDAQPPMTELEQVMQSLSEEVVEATDDGRLPVMLGGDHSISLGSLHGTAQNGDTGVIWFDAHPDVNTQETSPSGNIHGMPLAAALGYGDFPDWTRADIAEENVAIVGLRSVDDGERELLADSDVTVYTMEDIDRRGIGDVTRDALDVAGTDTENVHVSLDMDWLDPKEAPGVGTPVPGGVTYREAHLAMELVAEHNSEHGSLRSIDVVEVNPIRDRENKTGKLVVELVASALGKRIL